MYHFNNFLYNNKDVFVYWATQEEKVIELEHTYNDSIDFMKALDDLDRLSLNAKIRYLQEKSFNLYDVIDLLENDIFFDDEYFVYYKSLNTIDLSILLQILIPSVHAFKNNDGLDAWLSNDFDSDWQTYFVRYVRGLSLEEKHKIEEYVRLYKVKII